MDEDVKRMLALEDQLFEVALKYHFLSKHAGYLPECDDRTCMATRKVLGGDIFMVKYGTPIRSEGETHKGEKSGRVDALSNRQ